MLLKPFGPCILTILKHVQSRVVVPDCTTNSTSYQGPPAELNVTYGHDTIGQGQFRLTFAGILQAKATLGGPHLTNQPTEDVSAEKSPPEVTNFIMQDSEATYDQFCPTSKYSINLFQAELNEILHTKL